MEPPVTKYARSGDVHIAYQVFGAGPVTLIGVPPVVSAIELQWEEPHAARFLRRLGSMVRMIHFDKRGCGSSDRDVGDASLEDRIDDLRAIMDAERIERAAIGGLSEGGAMCILFAATYPERVSHLLLGNTTARFAADDDYPYFPSREFMERICDIWAEQWGTPETFTIDLMAPTLKGDEQYMRYLNRLERASTSPRGLRAMLRLAMDIDVRPIVPTLRVPTLVLHRRGDQSIPVENGRWLAENIPGARYVELEGQDHFPWIGDADSFLDAQEEFLLGVHHHDVDRVLKTVLFTDIVDSTPEAARLGDRRWREVLDGHDRVAAREIALQTGRLVKRTGDGLLATFDGPARAIRCARTLVDTFARQGLQIRAGVHTGEVEVRDDDVAGIAVHIGARVAGAAGGSEVLVSRTVKDLVAGSGIAFTDRGVHQLKGIAEDWQLYAVSAVSG